MNLDEYLEPKAEHAVLLTGASGLIGGRLWRRLQQRADVRLTLALREPLADLPDSVATRSIASLEATDWQPVVRGHSVVVHAAARVHVLDEQASDPLAAFRRVNVEGTLALARAAAAAGVQRFVFVSSVKAAGGESLPGKPLRADDPACPDGAYGLSKREAEEALLALAADTGMQVVIVRPVLVYGPGVGGNFRRLMRWVRSGWPLPLAAVDNRRSMLALDNLVDLLNRCIDHPRAVNQIFMASDGDDVSTPELLRRLAQALGCPLRLLPLPVGCLQWLARACGKSAEAERLLGSLQVDIGKTREYLDWAPPLGMPAALALLRDEPCA